MKTEEIKVNSDSGINIKVGDILVNDVDTPPQLYRLVYITADDKAILVSTQQSDSTINISLLKLKCWLKVID